jgi:ferric-dicitrate binding protein FerR (iron transport regulator)
MQDSNVNLIIRYLSKEELTTSEFELVKYLQKSNSKEFVELQLAYETNIFKKLDFNSEKGWDIVQQKLSDDKSFVSNSKNYLWLKIAATVLLLFSIGFTTASYYSWNVEVLNQTGNLQDLTLPDGSHIVLDKGARIQYTRTLLDNFNRRISLTGRAHFSIAKNPEKPFIIYNPLVDVQVLGTQFTINQLADQTQIILQEGSIKLSGKQLKEDILMTETGSLVIISETGFIRENKIFTNLYSSWMQKRLSFENCTIGEVYQFLNDSYGIKITVQDSSQLNATLSGSAPSDDPALIIEAINTILISKSESNKHK